VANLISGITFVNTYNGGLGYWGGYHPRISHDGTFITFDTVPGYASWVAYDGAQLPPFINVSGEYLSSGAEHVYLKNMATGALASLDPVMIGDFGLDEAPGGDTTSISADGGFVAYQVPGLYEFDLPPSGANVDQVNIVNTATGAIINPNTNASGVAGNGFSGEGSLSATGRYVTFTSDSTNLVSNDTNGRTDVFLKDTVTGEIRLVSVASNGTQGNSNSGFQHEASVSSDGRYVLFQTSATNFGSSSSLNIFVKDMQTGALMGLGTENLGAKNSSMTADGRYVVFEIDPFDGYGQVYRFDTLTQSTVLVSTNASGTAGNDDSRGASISADIFVKDLATGAVARLSVSASGAEQNGISFDPEISGDGHYVVFQSGSSNLISGDTNGNPDLFMAINPFWGTAVPSSDITGTSGKDALTGTSASDTILGLGGNDTLIGGTGNDTLLGGGGNDSLNGGTGGDSLNGDVGSDVLIWDTLDTKVDGGAGVDTLKILSGNLNVPAVPNGKIVNIEKIDMTVTKKNTLTLNKSEVLDMSTTSDALTVIGNSTDIVNLKGDFVLQSSVGGFETWKLGTAIVKIEAELIVI
jgi:Ca2+-binding RTX toxin-like protein